MSLSQDLRSIEDHVKSFVEEHIPGLERAAVAAERFEADPRVQALESILGVSPAIHDVIASATARIAQELTALQQKWAPPAAEAADGNPETADPPAEAAG